MSSQAALRRILSDRLQERLQIDVPSSSHSELDAIFTEEPPALSTFVQDSRYMANPPLGPIQFDFVRHLEQVLFPRTYVQMVAVWGDHWLPVRFVNEMILEWGKGSGKDHVCQLGMARVANLLLCMKSPQVYFGLPHQAIIHMLNVARSAPQAHGVFFKPLRSLLVNSKWFEDKFEGDEPGPQAGEVRFKKHIELISGHSDADTLEGKNLLVGVADEIAAFASQKMSLRTAPVRTAEGIMNLLRTSTDSRFPEGNGKVAAISYPRYKGDPIKTLMKTAQNSLQEEGAESAYYASGPHRSWDVNPRLASVPRVKVPGASEPVPKTVAILRMYKDNPAEARGMYECAPEGVMERYFADERAVMAAQAGRDDELVEVEYYVGIDAAAGEKVRQWQTRFNISSELRPIPGALYSIHGDMAATGDRAGIAMSHVKEWWSDQAGADEATEDLAVVHTDFSIWLEADKNADDGNDLFPREIQLRWFRQLVLALQRRGFPIGRVSLDGWQSRDSIQILLASGLDAKLVSMDRTSAPWKTLKDLIYTGRVSLPNAELLRDELLGLVRIGDKIDHPPGGSKDVADAVCGSVDGALEVGGREVSGAEEDLYGLPVTVPTSLGGDGFSVSGGWGGSETDTRVFGR